MSDSDPQSKSPIPSWQKQTSEPATAENPQDSSKAAPKETRMAQAKKFLETDEVRNTSTSKQVSFLESKGYTAEEINELLGVERNTEATVSKTSTTPAQPPSPTQSPSNTPVTLPSSQLQMASQQSQPPIITYPEFLVKPTAPSPLITSSRLLTTMTLFSSIYMILYGSNKYLLTPMQQSLTQARHELLSRASDRLSTLNSKLANAVSEEPDTVSPYKDQEDDESDGDPTEMFHRDIGIQTSPSLLNASPSRPSSPHESPDSSASPLEAQLSRLSVISSHLNEINSTSTSEGADATELTTTIGVVRDYLESMAFTPPTYSYGSLGYSGMVRDMVGSGGKEEPDEIAKLKASIRSVKGVLLSARSFPSTGRGVGITGIR